MHAEALIEIGLLPPPLSPTPLSPPLKGGEVIGARLPPLPLREGIKGWVKRPARYALYFLFAALLLTIRSEEHTSELQSLMRTSYAVFCLKKKTKNTHFQSRHILSTTK